jgi:hypothetical protein
VPVALLWALVTGLLVAGGPAPAVAATITVDTFAQLDAAKCTVADAINSANDDINVAGCVRVGGIGADTIVLPADLHSPHGLHRRRPRRQQRRPRSVP